MSYTYLQEQGEESLAECFSDIAPCALWKLNHTAGKSYSNGNGMESYHDSQSGTMSEPSTESHGEESRMSSAVGSHARTSHALEKVPGSRENGVAYGQKWQESSVRFDLASSSWKTHQCLWEEDLEWSSVTLPKWGMMLRGLVLEGSLPGHVLTESGCGSSVQRPTASMWRDCQLRLKSLIRPHHPNGNLIEQWAQRYGTRLTPNSIEILMNWPEGWSDSRPLEMDRIQSWLRLHGAPSQEDAA